MLRKQLSNVRKRQLTVFHLSKQVPTYCWRQLAGNALSCFVFVLALLTISSDAYCQSNRDRNDRISDRFSTRFNDRQRRGDFGRRNRPDDPLVLRFRTIDGSFNNLRRETWGVAGANLWRRVPSAYTDGISSPARLDGESPREISNTIFDQNESIPNSRGLTDMVWQWGQFLDHDLDLTETHLPLEAFPIIVPTGDALFDPQESGSASIMLFRSIYNPSTGIATPREQVNEITSWIDGSNVYGSEEETAHSLRQFRNGMLKVSPNPTGQMMPVGDDGFFLAGDVRANEQAYLTAMHTLWVREHNRQCRMMLRFNPNLTDEQLYWNARKQVVAAMQAITYNEFLPALLGENALREYRGYNSNTFPNVTNAFSTAAYRFGHSMLNSELQRLDENFKVIPDGNLSLAQAFFNPSLIHDHGIEPYLRGLVSQTAQEVDAKVVGDVRNFLFGAPGSGGFDLVSLNIQRGRDHGLPDFNSIRVRYGLPAAATFADITSDPILRLQLAELYDSPNDVDPWVGMLCEDHMPNASVGVTAFMVIRDQFERLRDGDRFYYERDFSGAARDRIRNTRLSDIIRRNTTFKDVRRDVFRMP